MALEGGGGREGGEGGREGREGGREGGRERRDECYTYSNGPQYLNSSYVTYYVITCQSAFEYNNDITYYVITCKSPFDWVYTEQWYVIISHVMIHLEPQNMFDSFSTWLPFVAACKRLLSHTFSKLLKTSTQSS